MRIITSYSLIMINTVFHVTNGFSSFANNGELMNDEALEDYSFATEDLTTVFTTAAPGIWFKNVKTILSKCFKKQFPNMTEHLVEFSVDLHGSNIHIDFIATRPDRGRKRLLVPRSFQLFLNNRPCQGPRRL